MNVWKIEQDQENGGRIVRTALPRFRARWTTGDDRGGPGRTWRRSPPCPACAGAIRGAGAGRTPSTSTDSSGAPDQVAFERLMDEAAREIDAWIAGRL